MATKDENLFVGPGPKKPAKLHKSEVLDEFFEADYKTLIRKDTGDYVSYQIGFMWVCEIPTILAKTATIEALREIHASWLEGRTDEINWDEYEIIGVHIVREFGDLKSVRVKK